MLTQSVLNLTVNNFGSDVFVTIGARENKMTDVSFRLKNIDNIAAAAPEDLIQEKLRFFQENNDWCGTFAAGYGEAEQAVDRVFLKKTEGRSVLWLNHLPVGHSVKAAA